MLFRPYNNSPAYSLNAAFVRRVWAQVTRTPQATFAEMARTLRSTKGNVVAAVRVLEAAGYVECDPYLSRARRVLVPLWEGR